MTRKNFVDRAVLPALGIGLVAWLAAPDATPAIAPRAALGWTLAAVGIAAVFLRSRLAHVAAAGVLALAAEHLLLSPGMPRGHDLLSHSWGVWAFFQAMADGDAFPKWLHDVGLGMPVPIFYSPTAYYSMTPFYWLGESPMTIFKSGFAAFAILGAISMYFVARRWTGSSRAGLVAAAAFAFAPYRLLSGHYRQALAESAGLVILPVVFLLFFGPGAWSRRRVAGTAVVTGLLIVTHPLSVLTVGVVGALWQGLEAWRIGLGPQLRRRLAMRALAACLGLLAAGFYAVPLASRLGSISVDEAAVRSWKSGEIRLARQGLRPSQPLKRLPWTGLARSEPRGMPRDVDGEEVPHYLGWGLFGCALLAGAHGLWRARRRRASATSRSRQASAMSRSPSSGAQELAVAIIALGSLALTFHAAAAVLAHLPLMPKLQFAWRFLGPATVAAALAAGFVARLLISTRREAAAALLMALLVADAFPYTGAADWAPAAGGFAHFYNLDPKCGERWGCWDTEEVEGPLPLRVFGPFLPPSRFGEHVANVKPGYGEYLNPRAVRLVKAASSDDDWARLGVGLRAGGLPGVTRLDAAPYAQWRAAADADPRPLEFRRRAATIDVELPGEPGELVILEQYLPGWEATVDGEDAALEPTEDGLLRLAVPAGTSRARLRFRFRGADVVAGRVATFLALAACLALARRRDREEGAVQ